MAKLVTKLDSFGYLAWSSDSAYVYFDTFLSRDSGYFRLRISDAKVEKLVDLKKIRLFASQFGPGSGPATFPCCPATSAPRRLTRSTCSFPDASIVLATDVRRRLCFNLVVPIVNSSLITDVGLCEIEISSQTYRRS